MEKKSIFKWLLTICLILCLLPADAFAADNSRNYNFDFASNGKQEISTLPGEIITFTVVLERTDSEKIAEMYANQAEFWYDDTFLELVDSSVMTADGVKWVDSARRTGGRALYLNFLSNVGGVLWESKVQMGSFQM